MFWCSYLRFLRYICLTFLLFCLTRTPRSSPPSQFSLTFLITVVFSIRLIGKTRLGAEVRTTITGNFIHYRYFFIGKALLSSQDEPPVITSVLRRISSLCNRQSIMKCILQLILLKHRQQSWQRWILRTACSLTSCRYTHLLMVYRLKLWNAFNDSNCEFIETTCWQNNLDEEAHK